MNYNKLQQEAIDNDSPKIVVVAPPGSGKTHSLVGAISKYAEEHPFDRITAITFTRKAASELQFKLNDKTQVDTRTIHSWSLAELNRLAAKHKFKVDILSDIQVQEILQFLCKRLGYYSINYYLLTAFVMGNYNIDVKDNEKNRYKKVLATYIEYKRDNQLYDFTDLPLYLYDMLQLYNERIGNIDALFVDEFQDVDGTQAVIFTMVDAKKHFYIGDPDQSIYIFRGAEASVINSLSDQGFVKLRLEENYRSYQSILDYSTQILDSGVELCEEITSLTPSWVKCVRTDQPGEVYTINQEGRALDVVNQKERNPFNLVRYFMEKKPYILCRSNKWVKAIQALGYKDVSTVHQAKGLEYRDVIYTDTPLSSVEETNIAYVACTRARDSLMVVNFQIFMEILQELMQENDALISNQILF
jgi:superfamily I DNA/RNA helicase